MTSNRTEAVNLMTHYFTMVMARQELKIDSDTTMELEQLVDHIIQAAVEQAVASITQHLRGQIE